MASQQKKTKKTATASAQQSETSCSETSTETNSAIVAHSGARALGWSRDHLRLKKNVCSHKDTSRQYSETSEVKFVGARGVAKYLKININRQMDNSILLYSEAQSSIFKKKDCAHKTLFAKKNYCTQSSGNEESRSDFRRKIRGIEGDHVLHKK